MQLLTTSYKYIDILSPSEQILTSVDGNTSLSGSMWEYNYITKIHVVLSLIHISEAHET